MSGALRTLAVLLLVVAAWDQAWMPLQAHRAGVERDAERAEALYRWVQGALPRLSGQAGPAAGTMDTRIAAEAVQTGARRFGLTGALRRIEPRDDGVHVQLEAAPFDATIGWLGALEGERGLRVRSLRLGPAASRGQVSGTVVLAAAAP